MQLIDEYQLGSRRTLKPGCKVKVTGVRGTFKYRCASVSIEGNVSIHVCGEQGFRAFRPERIAKILRGRNVEWNDPDIPEQVNIANSESSGTYTERTHHH